MDQKYKETDQKFEETINQQIEILKVLKKAETDQKFEEKGQKFEETDQKKGKSFNYFYWETDTKYSEIPQHSGLLRDFFEFLKNIGNSSEFIFDLFLFLGISVLFPCFHVTKNTHFKRELVKPCEFLLSLNILR